MMENTGFLCLAGELVGAFGQPGTGESSLIGGDNDAALDNMCDVEAADGLEAIELSGGRFDYGRGGGVVRLEQQTLRPGRCFLPDTFCDWAKSSKDA
jgi:hypothetical protein